VYIAPLKALVAERVKDWRKRLGGLGKRVVELTGDTAPDLDYVALLKKQIAAIRVRDAATNSITKVMIMDQLAKPRDTFVLTKGNYEAKTDVRVFGHIPEIFALRTVAASASKPTAPTALSRPPSLAPAPASAPAGETPALPAEPRLNRLDLARWLV
jgi:hypothetical protein